MKDIVFTLEFDDDSANSRANNYLEKGWTLLHVGTKVIDLYNEQTYYNTAYVVGANQEQYDAYKKELEEDKFELI
ncbi:hypothetical protein ACTFRD_30435 [Bacillus cereus group sp. MYBK249-1]|uniref:DUF2812 domain-containing protein n=2 Tax=Bacillus cereus group TaxID=86661 RepID=A0A9W3ZTX0_BACTO|nr:MULTISPECIES: hypothetical protein [Bacillus cereus group]MDA2523368.1 hypothetical protein [Bacillus cereus]EOQ06914.1 hypothetical protein IKC_00802 [Bacillus cereus VD184]KAB1363843.1 hypothetical protein FPG89_31495 [Bacillus thuringiensis]MDA2557921.1 hypothetical protein [Bacillus cereus]MDR4147896.1 hypothetical protein [Bacillus thuringiensis]